MLANREYKNENIILEKQNKKNFINKEKLRQLQNADTKNAKKQENLNDKKEIDKDLKMEIDSCEGKITADHSNNVISSMELYKTKKEIYEKKHQEKLNHILISNYGSDIYNFSVELENQSFNPDPLKNHQIDSDIRTKMIDWMLEVLNAYNSEIYTFNLSVLIMDMYFAKSKTTLLNKDVHLIGICSLFIASKMEDIYPIRMSHVKTKISHGKFSEKDIRKKERAILEALNFEVITTSTSDFIKTFIYDFIHNNRSQIEKLQMWHHLDAYENVTIFLAKMISHSIEFNQYK